MAVPVLDDIWEGVTHPFPTKEPHDPASKASDVVVKDEKIRASTLIARYTGWRGTNARIARGVMGGESSFNPEAENFCCVGLMQVNAMVHKGKFGMPADEQEARRWLKDPINNVKAAYALWLSVGGSWEPWEAYTNGSWKLHTHQDPTIILKKKTATGAVGDAVADAADAALGPVDEFIGALLSPSTWFRIGKGALGGTLIVLGTGAMVFVIASRSPIGRATPVGKAASVIKSAAK